MVNEFHQLWLKMMMMDDFSSINNKLKTRKIESYIYNFVINECNALAKVQTKQDPFSPLPPFCIFPYGF